MSIDLRRAARAIFLQVIPLAPEQRPQRAEELTAGDAELRAEVMALLSADADADEFLARNAHQVAGLDEPEPEPPPVRHVDGYELVGEIGRGGMGVVYEAREVELGRRVALKFLLPGKLAPAESTRRFRREIQTLARLRHPAIVPIFATGHTADGRPFFAMERVEGAPLGDFVRRHRSTRDERLRLFLQVCRAVAHAHQNGVIHRDLKPSNLLVEESDPSGAGVPHEPRVRVLDFGLAMMTHDGDNSIVESSAGTLTYMSPEQTEEGGDWVDVRSDVYSLGVILHELLLDRLPYDAALANPVALLREIRCHETGPQALMNAGLDRELASIIAKALRRSRDDRYQSASALFDDVSRYLKHLPVEAVPPSSAYYAGKILRRHRWFLAAAATALVSVTAMAAVWKQSAERTRAERQLRTYAEASAALAARSHGSAFRIEGGYPGAPVSRKERLRVLADRMDTDHLTDPVMDATVRRMVGEALRTMGAYPEAEQQLRVAYEELRRSAPDGLDWIRAAEQWATTLVALTRFDEADEVTRLVYQTKRERFGDDHDEVQLTRKNIAVLRYRQGRLMDAEALLRILLEQQSGRDHEDLRRAELQSILAVVRRDQGDLPEALQLSEAALDVQRMILGLSHPDTLSTANNRALMMREDGRVREAAELLRQVTAELRREAGDRDSDTLASIGNLAACCQELGDVEQASQLYQEALAAIGDGIQERQPQALKLNANYAMLLLCQGKQEEAEDRLRRSLAGQREVLGDRHPDTLGSLTNLGVVLGRAERHEEAGELLVEALGGYLERGRERTRTVPLLYYLGGNRLEQGRPAEAEAWFAEADAGLIVTGGRDDRRLMLLCGRARALAASGCVDEAEECQRQAVTLARVVAPPPYLGRVLVRHAELLWRQGRLAEAYDAVLHGYALLHDGRSGWLREAEDVLLAVCEAADGACTEPLRELFGRPPSGGEIVAAPR